MDRMLSMKGVKTHGVHSIVDDCSRWLILTVGLVSLSSLLPLRYVLTMIRSYAVVVTGRKLLHELASLPDEVMSFNAAANDVRLFVLTHNQICKLTHKLVC
jgi:hypothetical protein